jgi:hypothetical protein
VTIRLPYAALAGRNQRAASCARRGAPMVMVAILEFLKIQV